MGFGSGHGSVTLLPEHERPEDGRFHRQFWQKNRPAPQRAGWIATH